MTYPREREQLNPLSIPQELEESRERAAQARQRAGRLRSTEPVGASLPDRPVPARPEVP